MLMRLIFAGTPTIAATVLSHLADGPHEVVAIYTRADAQKGRGRKLIPSPVKELALELGIPVYTPPNFKDPTDVEMLRSHGADAAVVVAYGVLLPQNILDIPTYGWFNLHYSKLPRWRGAAPVQRAIEAGDTETAATFFQIEAGLDTGPILACKETSIQGEENSGELLERLTELGLPLIDDALSALASGTAVLTPQTDEDTCYAKRISSSEGQINWEDAASEIHRQVRAFTPEPGCWSVLPDGSRLKIAGLLVSDEQSGLAPGQIRVEKRRVLVGCGKETTIELGQVAPAGKKWMAAADWGRGARLEENSRFQNPEPDSLGE